MVFEKMESQIKMNTTTKLCNPQSLSIFQLETEIIRLKLHYEKLHIQIRVIEYYNLKVGVQKRCWFTLTVSLSLC